MAASRMLYVDGTLPNGAAPSGDAAADSLTVPSDPSARARFETALKRFCSVFPDAFYVSERGLIFLKEDTSSRGRLLSAGFHLMVGYFRDDAPLGELILDEPAKRELDSLWQEFNFITHAPSRQYKDFIFFERAEPPRFMEGAEFDFARSEDKDSTSDAKINHLARAYLEKARRKGAKGPALDAIKYYFDNISGEIRGAAQSRLAAEASHLDALQDFAERAYRRPITKSERADLLGFYHALRDCDGLSHEDAFRDCVASVLVSPEFFYRIDSPPAGKGIRPLPDYALASRLSYFLWSSMPDDELLRHAAAGDLHHPKVLAAQARRLLQDDRIRGLATEFGGNWLDFRRFEEHNAVDRERFKSFNNDLREAMFEEPIQFFIHLIREQRPVSDFLYGDYTFVNPNLARHYGIPTPGLRADDWMRVDRASEYGRGGLLPMSVFLTKNAPGLRTSPVKRGYWVVRRLLGEQIPPPPAKVPELPADEKKLGDLTLREALARHRDDPSCAGCHKRFDAVGLVFEGYGPIGERRTADFGGRPVDSRAVFPGGGEGTGLAGLQTYLRDRRQDEFLDNLCRKLLAYALGRTLVLSDDRTVEAMRAKLPADGYRFDSLVESIVTSPQFLNQRCRADVTMK